MVNDGSRGHKPVTQNPKQFRAALHEKEIPVIPNPVPARTVGAVGPYAVNQIVACRKTRRACYQTNGLYSQYGCGDIYPSTNQRRKLYSIYNIYTIMWHTRVEAGECIPGIQIIRMYVRHILLTFPIMDIAYLKHKSIYGVRRAYVCE